MRIVFDREKLRQFMTLFCDKTAITITLFDEEMIPILDVGEWKNYCLAIGDDETRLQLCKKCDAKYAEKARKINDVVIYSCHAGIAEAVAPLQIDNIPVGYIMVGKFRDTDQRLSSPEKIKAKAAEYNLDEKYMLKCWEELPLADPKEVQDAILLLKLITNEIINDKLIRAAKTTWTDHVTEYIQLHIGENITVEDLCAATNLKRHELYAHFEQYFSLSPRAYINQLRLAKAKELLTTTELSIKQIGIMLGFKKVDVFTKFFKEKMGIGVTPLQYRKQKRLQPD